jgi:hypothetical protein
VKGVKVLTPRFFNEFAIRRTDGRSRRQVLDAG